MESTRDRKHAEEERQAAIRRQIALLQAQLDDGSQSSENPPASPKRKRPNANVLVPETPSKSSDPLIESLYEACNLDHLPPDELEKLIAHVIREDGFARLVRWSSLLAGVSAFTLTHRTADNGF